MEQAQNSETEQMAGPIVNLVPKAVQKVKSMLEAEGKQGTHGLRISVLPGGCAGFMYYFNLVNDPKPTEVMQDIEGIKVYIDKGAIPMIKGAKIEYIDALQGAGFKVINPNATSECGCGKSFG